MAPLTPGGFALGLLLAALLASTPRPLLAQVTSEIVRDGSIGPDATAQPVQTIGSGGERTFEITESLGERPGDGPNLFHSFDVFNLGSGDRAVFSADPGRQTARILSRVTGGSPSLLFGSLESRVPGADLYFLNPAGIVFGADAQLHVDGSVIATTAHALEFAGGKVFAADVRAPAPLLSAPGVEAFGFLERPASIDVLGARLAVPDGRSLALVGGDITLERAQLVATSGRVALAAVASPGRVRWSDAGAGAPALLDLEGFSALGDVALRSAGLFAEDASGRAGAIRIEAGALALDASVLSATGFGAGSAGTVDLAVQELAFGNRSVAFVRGVAGAEGGRIRVRADRLRLEGGSSLDVLSSGGGAAGSIDVQADVIALSEQSAFFARGLDGGRSGAIRVRGGTLRLSGGSVIDALGGGAGGSGGQIEVLADRVELGGGSGLSVRGDAGANAGSILLDLGQLRIEDGAFLDAVGSGGGSAGRVAIDADLLSMDTGGSIFAQNLVRGAMGGSIRIAVDRARLAGGSLISTSGFDGAAAGDIDLAANLLHLDGGSSLTAVASGGQRGGTITVRAADLSLAGASFVSTSGIGGDGGRLRIDAGDVRLAGGSILLSSGFDGGTAGEIDLTAGSLQLSGSSLAAESARGPGGGGIAVRAGQIALDGRSSVSASGFQGSRGGLLRIDAGDVRLGGGSVLLGSGFDGGAAGQIELSADSLRLDSGSALAAEGVRGGGAGRIAVRARVLALDGASALSVTGFEGSRGGLLQVDAGSISLTDRSSLLAEGDLGASGGTVHVLARDLALDGASVVSASGFRGSSGGRIEVTADSLRATAGGRIFARGNAAAGGDIVLRARDAFFSGALAEGFAPLTGLDVSSSGGTGAGTIQVFADALRVTDQTRIMAIGLERPGGDIALDVGRLLLTGGGQINTGSTNGPAGSITITARDLVEISNQGGGPFSIARALEDGMGGRPIDFGGVFAASGGPGVPGTRGGDISIQAPDIRIVDGGFVAAVTFGATDAADVRVQGERILITGGGGLDSSTGGAGAAGSVEVTASERVLIAGENSQAFPSRIRSITVSSGAAGDILIRAPTVEIDGGAVATSTLQAVDGAAAGAAGNIEIDAGTLSLTGGGRIDSSSFSGATGGRVDVRASQRLELRGQDSGISARAASDGDGGSIRVTAPELSLSDGASISSESSEGLGASEFFVRDAAESGLFLPPTGTPSGAAGSIALDVSSARLQGGSRISTLAAQGTDPGAPTRGNIDLSASSAIELSGNSEITASVVDGRGGDIRISTPGTATLRDGSRVVAQAEGGDASRFRQGGRIDIAAGAFVQEAGSLVSADAGQGVSGTVAINAPEVDLETELTPLPAGFLDAAALFQPRCAAAAQRADASSFVLAAQAALPVSPEELLVSLDPDRGPPDVVAAKRAVEVAEASGNAVQLASALGSLGNAFLGHEDPALAERYLARGLELARRSGAEQVTAALLNDLGNAQSARGAHGQARALYSDSARRSVGAAALRARSNAARAALRADDLAGAAALADEVYASVDAQAEGAAHSRAEIELWIHLGVTQRSLAERLPERRERFLLRANRLFEQAAARAAASGDWSAAAYALGDRGALYEDEHRVAEALELTRQALTAADRAGQSESLYRWHSQLGRLLWAMGQANDALEAHRRAVRILNDSRQELRYRYARGAGAFGTSIGPVYRELVQALLAASALGSDPALSGALLLEARDAVEQLKAAELRDYFRDECLAGLEARAIPLDAVSDRSAVVYPIVLPDRLELLLTVGRSVKRYSVAVSGEALAAETQRFRTQLGQYATARYLQPSWQLYDWLVRPYAADLAESNVDTLVFVTGGPLRTIPLAALHDRQRFLIERYAVAVTPSLALTDPRPLQLSGSKLLLAGISEPVHGFGALPSVDKELRAIESIYGGTLLIDATFTSSALREKLQDREFSAVHLASHARFTGSADSSFLLAYDGPVSIDQLSDAVRATRFRERPLELLVMSACDTAAGDEQAALGLAGVAIKSGARSAVGSLWNLNDQSATEVMLSFYRTLHTGEASKAQAMRRAQLELIRKGAHPYFWSPFLVIGNWL